MYGNICQLCAAKIIGDWPPYVDLGNNKGQVKAYVIICDDCFVEPGERSHTKRRLSIPRKRGAKRMPRLTTEHLEPPKSGRIGSPPSDLSST